MRCPYAILTACAHSHVFEERRFTVPSSEEEAVKIGRSVARWKPNTDNAIFDCKVLSRNHALLWQEDGAFLLKDTRSSNGTFVNNERLSKSAEESVARQIFSGDILQFGVEIVENANKKVCAPENASDYHNTYDSDSSSITLPLIDPHQLFQLQQYMREAVFRERALEEKLARLQRVLSSTEQAAETSWQALINEEQMLSRIEMLEGQLALYSKNAVSEKIKEQMSDILADKNKFETLAKESLRRAQEERCEALQRLADVERSLLNAEENSNVLGQRVVDLECELAVAIDTNGSLREQVTQLQKQLKSAEANYGHLAYGDSEAVLLLCVLPLFSLVFAAYGFGTLLGPTMLRKMKRS
ncbi:unnamed protein product [Gongylonema pulchrum]|uniref:FHA domain-containing protein n=1 Tax=Gongylonema pulchrum TaxID=637853 RepID=A0A183DRI8_9BILA|nr:unnamed protein product [Gongylonema pulchrum]